MQKHLMNDFKITPPQNNACVCTCRDATLCKYPDSVRFLNPWDLFPICVDNMKLYSKNKERYNRDRQKGWEAVLISTDFNYRI